MDIAASDIVQSAAGRDRGELFAVLAVEGEYLLLADGKEYHQQPASQNPRGLPRGGLSGPGGITFGKIRHD